MSKFADIVSYWSQGPELNQIKILSWQTLWYQKIPLEFSTGRKNYNLNRTNPCKLKPETGWSEIITENTELEPNQAWTPQKCTNWLLTPRTHWLCGSASYKHLQWKWTSWVDHWLTLYLYTRDAPSSDREEGQRAWCRTRRAFRTRQARVEIRKSKYCVLVQEIDIVSPLDETCFLHPYYN